MSEALIRVTQLPQIEERVRDFKEAVTQRTEEAKSLVCTEESLAFVKQYRSDLRKDFDELERQRKAVKAAVMAPLEQFDSVYKECVSDAFRAADADLKRKVDDTENTIKGRCEDGLREYFDELCAAHGLDWLTFERAGIRVDMASAKQKTPKKLREQLVNFVAGVSKDVETLNSMDNPEELMAVYKECLSVTIAFGIVSDRHRRVEEERVAREERAARKAAEAEAVRKVEACAPPTVVAERDTLTTTFTVTDTRERLIALREWMKANNYQYK